jgi:uncharacterized GH25 family protein
MRSFIHKLTPAILLASYSVVYAHFVWIGPVSPQLKVGETVMIQIGNGHTFPASESAMSSEDLKVFALTPSGARTEIAASVSGKALSAQYEPKEEGMYRFAFVQDRGVMSQTTKGYLPGGKDHHPGAMRSFKSFRSAVAYAWTPDARFTQGKAVGIPFEMTAAKSGSGVVVTVLKDGKPASGVEISSVWPGQKEEKAGTSGADGRFTYNVPAGAKGPFLLLANIARPVQGATYQTENYNTALHLSW